MSQLERQIRSARRRLWINRWLAALGWSLLAAASAWAVSVAAARLFALEWPLGRLAGLAGGAAMAASLIWLVVRRDSLGAAAEAIDQAANLRERVSSSLYVPAAADDPFEQAVLHDAQRAMAGIRASRLIPIRWSRSLNYGAAVLLLAAGLYWLLPGMDLLGAAQARERELQLNEQRRRVAAAIEKPVAALKEVAERNPQLKQSAELQELLELARDEKAELPPDKMRIEALKKLDRLGDQLEEAAKSDKFESLDEFKKMMSRMDAPSQPMSAAGQLMQALQKGDFKSAAETVKQMQEQLAKRDRSNPAGESQAKEMAEQLEQLSKALERLDASNALEKLQQAGISEQDAKRMLDALNKKDARQLEQLAQQLQKQLEKKGMSPEQARQKLKQLQQQAQKSQQAQQMAQKLAQQLSQCSKCAGQGDNAGAAQSLEGAGESLSEMEMMDQQLSELESQMSELDQLKDSLGDGQCKGGGEGNGQGDGRGDWAKGSGRGAGLRERSKDGQVGFERRKAKVRTGRGDVIGTQFIKGQQLRGESQAEFAEAAEAAERDATDAVNRERVPRTYHEAVKRYFDRFGQFEPAPGGAAGEKPAPPSGGPAKSPAGAGQ